LFSYFLFFGLCFNCEALFYKSLFVSLIVTAVAVLGDGGGGVEQPTFEHEHYSKYNFSTSKENEKVITATQFALNYHTLDFSALILQPITY
jgi:hypothetical protein